MWLFINLLSGAFMTGLIWLVQLVHYPAFHFVERDRFAEFHRFHSKRISWIVAPVMTLELLSAYLLLVQGKSSVLLWCNFSVVGLIFAITAFVSVPLHNQLANGYDRSAALSLVRTNWLRTLLWTFRTLGLLVAIVYNFVDLKAPLL